MADFSVHEFSYVRLQIFFFSSVHFYLLQFLFGITRKKNCFSFIGYSNMCFCSVLRRKKKLFQFYRLLKSLFLFGIKRKKKLLQFFFRLYYICYRLYKFLFLFSDNRQHQDCSFPVSVVFKLFEDCSFSVSIVLKYLFLYSNIFRLCTAVLHSKIFVYVFKYCYVFICQKWLRLRLRLTLFRIMEKSQKSSMVPISRDDNKRCCSIS